MKAIYDTPLPDGWDEKPLGSMVKLRRGYTWTKENEIERPEDGAFPVIRIPNIQDRLELTDLLYLRNVSSEALEKAAVSKGWILFVGSNGSQDRIGDSVLLEENQPMVFASFLMGMTPKDSEKLLPEFLSSWMRIHFVHEAFSKTSQQTTGLANFSWGAVRKLPLRFPLDVDEQRRISIALKLADNAIDKANAELRATRELKQSLMQKLFISGVPGRHSEFVDTKIGRIPKGWLIKQIKNILVDKPMNGYSPQSNPEPPGTKTLNVSCIRNGECDISKATYVDIKESVVDSLQVMKGDFFVLRGNGNRDYIGIGGIVRDEIQEPMIYSDLLFRIRFLELEAVPLYIPYMWQSLTFLHRLQSKAKSGSGLWKIGKRDIEKEFVALPDKVEQQEIVDIIESITNLYVTIENKVEVLQKIKKSLLQTLLTGKIRIPEGAIHE